jgi:hypothetical protein
MIVDTVIESAARALFVQWWADQCSCGFDSETCRLDGDGHEDWDATAKHTPNDTGNGVELMDIAPEAPLAAKECAVSLVTSIIKLNGIKTWGSVCSREEVENDAEGFGHNLAMEALGHGVGWADDHDGHGLILPYVGFYGDSGEVSERLAQRGR